jgi:hypothetical protein
LIRAHCHERDQKRDDYCCCHRGGKLTNTLTFFTSPI